MPPCDTSALYCLYSDAFVNTTGKPVEVNTPEATTSLHITRLSFMLKVSKSSCVRVVWDKLLNVCVFKVYLLYGTSFCMCVVKAQQ